MKQAENHLSSPDFPLYFRLARTSYALLDGRRGKYFLYNLLKKMGLLGKTARFPFFGSHIHVPLAIPETLYIRDFTLFQSLREINFANAIYQSLRENSTLIDCGAAFGQVSCRMAKLCPNISNIMAIEPNSESCAVLQQNLSLLENKTTHLINAAASDFAGKGELCFPHGKADSHSAYIKEAPEGEIDVIRLDDLKHLITGDLALKLDVEGGELAAIAGAAEIIASAENICFFIEIHPAVLERSGHKAEELLQAISNIRTTKWVLADAPLTEIDPWKPFFNQVERRIYDVIGISPTKNQV